MCRHGNRGSCWVTAYKMIQDAKKTRSDDCNRSDEIWAMSYSVIGGIISANTVLVLEVSPLRKGRVDGSTQEQNRWLKTASGKAITRNCTALEEKNSRKVCYT